MRVLVTGAAGQLGSDVVAALRQSGDVAIPATRQLLDVCDPRAVDTVLASERPDAVVNCAAYHDVAGCEANPELARAVNTRAVRSLAAASRKFGARFMTVSTDYVFDGAKPGGYTEDDAPRPLNQYGKTKLEGEQQALEASPETFVVRTQSLFGLTGPRGKGRNFVDLMLKLSAERNELKVDQCRMAPTGTGPLAENMIILLRTDRFGLYHMSCEGETSWFEFAKRILELMGSKATVTPVANDFYPRTFERPENTYLINAALRSRGLDRMPHWESALVGYLRARGHTVSTGNAKRR